MRGLWFLTLFLFFLLIYVGLTMAAHTPLWNDEYYSLMRNTVDISYKRIIEGAVIEGNNSPLFYVLQKLQCDALFYFPPVEWVVGHWESPDVYDRVFLRVQSVVFMSIALSILFHYFSRRYSLWIGFYALTLALSLSCVWFHWAEARPYALWFTLSIFQMLLLIEAFEVKSKRNDRLLIATHVLLALTVTISAVQIIAVACLWWLKKERSLKLYALAILLPLAIIVFYYSTAPKYQLFFVSGPIALVSANFPKERMALAFIFLGSWVYFNLLQKKWILPVEAWYLLFMGVMMGIFTLILIKLKLKDLGFPHGFQISDRYFFSLAPLCIIGTVIFSVYLMRVFKSKIGQVAVFTLLAIFMALRIHQLTHSFPL